MGAILKQTREEVRSVNAFDDRVSVRALPFWKITLQSVPREKRPAQKKARRESHLERLCSLASMVSGSSAAFVAVGDDEMCYVVASHGDVAGPDQQWPQAAAAIGRVMDRTGDSLLAEDVQGDGRFHEGSICIAEQSIRALAGIALSAPTGDRVGTLVVIDRRVRAFTAEQLRALEAIAGAASDRLELQRIHHEQGVANEDDRVATLERGTRELEAEIEQRKRAEERLTYAAYHDPLTGVANRAYLERRLGDCVAAAKGEMERRSCVFFIDLDRFKRVNDRLGHLAGDLLLTLVARRLERSVRPGDVVARLGGDEFMILLEGLGDIGEAEELAKRILATLAAPYRLERTETYVTVSIGVSFVDAQTDSTSDVLREADIAMYRAKEKGRNRVVVFQAFLRDRDVAIATLEADLRNGWEHRQFFLAYQPIVSLKSNDIVGFEALLRWNHPTRGIVMPSDFIAAAEEIGLIVPLGEMVISEACRELRRFQRDRPGSATITMSVNLSSMQLNSSELVGHVDRAVKLAEIDPQTFVIELTESVILEDFAVAADVLQNLRALGIRIHMDDFGTGYSSLNYLRQLPIDQIKIDGVFVSGADGRLQDPEIVDTIVSLAHKLGISAIAEGVETEAQRNELVLMGCDAAQGYLYSPAVVPLEASQMLALYCGKDMP